MQTGPHPTLKSPFSPVGRGSLRLLASLLTALVVVRPGHAQESTSVTIGPNPIGPGTSLSEPRTQPLDLKGPADTMPTHLWDYRDNPGWLGVREMRAGSATVSISRRYFLPIKAPALADTAPLEKLADGYPAGLTDHLGEPYYTAYGSLLAQKRVSPKRAQRLVFYRGEKQQLVAELRNELEAQADAPAQVRTAALATLSARQTPRLRELENEAEAIREDLSSPGLFKDNEDGADLVVTNPDLDEGKSKALRGYLLTVAAGQLHHGLSLEQRQLLEEIAMQKWAEANRESESAPDDSHLFFLPATSRIRLPAGLPPGLLAQIQVFREEKDRLKAELHAAIVREQKVFFVGQRTRAFARLAAHQAPQFAALESLAEEIRAGLAGHPYPDEPAGSELPPELTARSGTAIARKAELQRKLSLRHRELRTELPVDQIEMVREGGSPALAIKPGENATLEQEAARTKALATLAAFNEELRRDYTDLDAEMEALHRDIQRYAESRHGSGVPNANQLSRELGHAYARQETWDRYRDYHRAVLEPGLSPEQRRLLYQDALMELR